MCVWGLDVSPRQDVTSFSRNAYGGLSCCKGTKGRSSLQRNSDDSFGMSYCITFFSYRVK